MAGVPDDRNRKPVKFRSRFKKSVVVRAVPAPAGVDPFPELLAERQRLGLIDVRHEVGGKSELMRRLPAKRFRNPFGDEVVLPLGVAESLEDFEAGLRAAGLVAVDQVCVQFAHAPRKFWFKKIDAVVDHDNGPSRFFVKRAAPSERGSRFNEDPCQPRQRCGVPVKGPVGTCEALDGVQRGDIATDGCEEMPINRRNGEDLI